MKITLIGMGPGGWAYLLPAALERLREADLILGAARLLAALPDNHARIEEAIRAEDITAAIRAAEVERCAVVFSGDTGFFSGAARLVARLQREGMEAEILPGISSVQAFSARLGKSWQDWNLCSAHGARCDILAELKQGRPVFLLTGSAEDPARICRELEAAGLGDCPVHVGEALSYGAERVTSGSAAALTEAIFDPLNVMLVELPEELRPILRAPGIPDGEFLRGDVPMTKQEVRAAIPGKLGLGPTDVCWDVGAGTGSVSVELAMAGRAVWAVEKQPEACGLIRRNRERFRAWNLRLAEGEAPAVLEGLPRPDAVFVGGSAGNLTGILDAALGANPDVRLCVSAIAMETVHDAAVWMAQKDMEPEIAQISVSRTKKAGALHLLTANNPVFLISGRRP